MGVDTRKPPLPAPTESSTLQTSGEDLAATDLATNISRRTDHTSYSIPEDGSPITISTSKKKDHKHRDHESILTRASHQSQTSLLIEYFEAGKGPNVHSRPSVRVKVTPSSARKAKGAKDHIQITEAGGNRKPSYTRRISLGPTGATEKIIESDERSISSYTSAAEDSSLSGRRPPVEIEVMHKDQGSDLSGASIPKELNYVTHNTFNTSDISSMPPDSMLEDNGGNLTPRRNRSRSLTREEVVTTNDTLKTPSRRRSRSLSRERIAQKVIEKLGKEHRHVSSGGKHKHGSNSRNGSISKEQLIETVQSPKRRSEKSGRHHRTDEPPSGAESSIVTGSQLSDRRKSGDQYSFRSGTSKSSLNNPKLLETVEDAIRRLILPELTALKHEQKTQQNRSNFDRDRRDSLASGSSVSREELTRRVSKHSSAPDISGKPKVVLNRDDNHPGITLSGNSVKGRKERRRDRDYDSPSERSYHRGPSEETVIRDEENISRKRSKDGHRLRDAAAGAIAGGILTHAALKHHDSRSSVDRRERRKKRSKSHSRSASLAESTEEIFQKHEVPLMPMRSEINDSELTRDSILSERTSTPTSERHKAEIREVARGSPREVLSPASVTPTRSPNGLQRGLGTHHSNLSRGDVNLHSPGSERSFQDDVHHSYTEEAALAGAAAGVGAFAPDLMRSSYDRHEGQSYRPHTHGRGLSPIQSVASFEEESEPPNRDSIQQIHSTGSMSSVGQHHRQNSALSIDSLSSAASTNFARSKRPQGINLEDRKDVLEQHNLRDPNAQHHEEYSKDPAVNKWYDQQHEENERYRDSMEDGSFRESTIDVRHMTNYTDDSMDAPYLDKITATQQIRGVGGNAEYIHTPLAVESAVASLHDSSVIDVHSTLSGRSKLGERSYLDSPNDEQQDNAEYQDSFHYGVENEKHGSPLKQHYEADVRDTRSLSAESRGQRSTADMKEQGISQSLGGNEDRVQMGISGLPIADDPLPEIGHFQHSESDISTNPSIIQGPIGGVPHDNRDHWPYQPTPPLSKGDLLQRSNNTSAHESLKAVAANMLSAAAGAGAGAAFARREREKQTLQEKDYNPNAENYSPVQDQEHEYERNMNHDFGPIRDTYMSGHSIPTPPGAKDEGYISAANPRSAGALTPDYRAKGVVILGEEKLMDMDDMMAGDDPFVVGKTHARHLSGNSHGMPSPLYDSATGRGIDRIQSKDIVALMDHLTVRDAQRNARDTEILVTLVRSAAEMRNSFEDLKKFIAEQDDVMMNTSGKQHDRTVQKIIGGPRPQPLGTPRIPRRPSAEDDTMDDMPTKRRNVFRRALKGLSGGRNSNDLGRIEDMLIQLLGDVEGLKAGQDIRPNSGVTHRDSYQSYDDAREVAPEGYEPEGQAGTSSTGNQSGSLSLPPSRHSNTGIRGFDGRRASQNRVSTVLEGDEELDLHEQKLLQHQLENDGQLLTPTRELPRGESVPLDTPPAVNVATGAQSNEHTPKTATDKSRKHKSSSSSFFPKISRWSKTTASSAHDNDNVRSSGRRERPFSEASRSGSDLNYNTNEHYDPQGDDRLRSNTSLEGDRPPSPLIPSQVSEKPAYQAHRDSRNLQHPQPRQGPTGRYQNHLESQAQTFGSPISPTSDQWGSNPILSRFAAGPGNRHSGGAGNLSPISDAGFSQISAAEQSNAPVRPPKIRDDGPLIPPRPAKIAVSEGKPTFAERSAAANGEQRYSNGSLGVDQANGSPRSGQVPQRKPTGPRPISTSGNFSPDKGAVDQIKRTRYRGSPNHIDSSKEDVTF